MTQLRPAIVVIAWGLFPLSMCLAADACGNATQEPAQEQPRAVQLAQRLDGLVKEAERGARASLPKRVKSREDALRFAGEHAKSYRVLEHKGWWIVAWYGDDDEPWLWFTGWAIRKNSREIYRFGSW